MLWCKSMQGGAADAALGPGVSAQSRDAIVQAIETLRQMIYPGYFGQQGLTTQNVTYRMGEWVIELTGYFV